MHFCNFYSRYVVIIDQALLKEGAIIIVIIKVCPRYMLDIRRYFYYKIVLQSTLNKFIDLTKSIQPILSFHINLTY